jgi:hypothetical protein
MSDLSLKDLAGLYANNRQQKEAIDWFQKSTGDEKQKECAKLWRKGLTGLPIDFVGVFSHYKGLPDQNEAFDYLESVSHPKTLTFFKAQYKKGLPTNPLKVPFFSQLATPEEPTSKSSKDQHRTCFTSSMAMCLKFLGVPIAGDDAYFAIVSRYGDSTDWGAQKKAALSLGTICRSSTTATFEDVSRSLSQGFPVVLGILHKGSEDSPGGGHMIVAIGFKDNGDLICHDPYGSLNNNYAGASTQGRGVVYSKQMLTKRWTPEGLKSGWAMFFN